MDIKYEFQFKDNRTETVQLSLDSTTLSLQPLPVDFDDAWTQLECNQCPDCPLDSKQHSHCPVAHNLSSVMIKFKDDVSFENVTTRVITSQRVSEKQSSLESGVSSLMGLIMATSGCPILDRFRPMAFTHLPFADENETMFRAVSTYLTAQFVRMQNGKKPDWSLEYLSNMYEKVSRVNLAFTERLRQIKGKDANINALVSLDLFAQFAALSLKDNWIKLVEPFFSAYLDK